MAGHDRSPRIAPRDSWTKGRGLFTGPAGANGPSPAMRESPGGTFAPGAVLASEVPGPVLGAAARGLFPEVWARRAGPHLGPGGRVGHGLDDPHGLPPARAEPPCEADRHGHDVRRGEPP